MKQRQSGFTIVELMIATVVFSVILLVISGALIQIGRLYSKAVTSAHTQETARAVMSDISQTIKFETGSVTPTAQANGSLNNVLNFPATASPTTTTNRAVCIATVHYSYRFGQQVTGNAHGLVRNSVPSGCSSTLAQSLSGGPVAGTEMLGENMRLANLVIQQVGTGTAYQITVRVVNGPSESLCSPHWDPASCTSNAKMSTDDIAAARDLRCKDDNSVSEFCAVSELSTIVERRL